MCRRRCCKLDRRRSATEPQPLISGTLVLLPDVSVIESPLASRRIVVADDNRDIAQTLEALFDMEGHHIRVAYDGLQALDLCKQEIPEVAVLDIGMPNMDGHQAAQAIRALPGGEAVFLIALSGWGRPEDVDKAVNSGFNRHLTKPADLVELLEMVASA